jgi:hypothetical protein
MIHQEKPLFTDYYLEVTVFYATSFSAFWRQQDAP